MTQPSTALPTAPRIPAVTAEEMHKMDRVLVDEVGLPLIAMMEAAGRNLADAAGRLAPDAEHVTVLAGKGGNGGGGLAAARHLANRGLDVTVHLAHDRAALIDATATQARVLEAAGVPLAKALPTDPGDLVVDALLGYAQRGPPRELVAQHATWAQQAPARVVSLDVPTGLDPDDGTRHDPCILPALTVTLALPKAGLLKADQVATGEIWLADIGVPATIYQRYDAPAPLFREGPLLKLTTRPR